MAVATFTVSDTRAALHRLAEHVVSPARHAETGRIGLRPHPGGLRTPAFGKHDRIVAVELDELVVRDSEGVRRTTVTTLRDAGAFVGVRPGAPADVYPPATECDLDAPLVLDRDAMRLIADWYVLGADALDRLASEAVAEQPSECQLWPEHLDLAITMGAVNYGFSPGDQETDEPYVYVGPHAGPPRRDEFWNSAIGAIRTARHVLSTADALAFFHQARADDV
jgi:hypothetical protein